MSSVRYRPFFNARSVNTSRSSEYASVDKASIGANNGLCQNLTMAYGKLDTREYISVKFKSESYPILENAFKNVIYEMAAIFSEPTVINWNAWINSFQLLRLWWWSSTECVMVF